MFGDYFKLSNEKHCTVANKPASVKRAVFGSKPSPNLQTIKEKQAYNKQTPCLLAGRRTAGRYGQFTFLNI
jgi:hypothetical protein